MNNKTPLINSYLRKRIVRVSYLTLILITVIFVQNSFAWCVHNTTKFEANLFFRNPSNITQVAVFEYKPNEYRCIEFGEENIQYTVTVPALRWKTVFDGKAADNIEIKGSARPNFTTSATNYPEELYVQTFDKNGLFQYDSRRVVIPPNAYPTKNRNVRFLATADPQYWKGNGGLRYLLSAKAHNNNADRVLYQMNKILRDNRSVRGILVAGDLTQDGKDSEVEQYRTAVDGLRRFYYDGIGNHYETDVEKLNIAHEFKDTALALSDGPHYSWDWHDVHFVQLNVFPGTDVAPAHPIDPLNSLLFLKLDLAFNVGASGRPVVLIHHYGFDGFSVNDSWWSQTQQIDYLDALRNYNVIGMFTGHVHLTDNHTSIRNWRITLPKPLSGQPPCGTSGTCNNFVSGAARGGVTLSDDKTKIMSVSSGVFLDVTINDCNEMIIWRNNDAGTPVGNGTKVSFTTPLSSTNSRCNAPVPNAGGPYSAVEGDQVTLDASGTTDADADDSLEYRWKINGNWEAWDSSDTRVHTFSDNSEQRLELLVRDEGGNVGVAYAPITVTNVAPTLTAALVASEIGEINKAEISGSISDKGMEDSFTLKIDWGGGAVTSTDYPAGTETFTETHLYDDDGTYNIQLTLADDDGGQSTDSFVISVINLAPDALLSTSKDEVKVGETVEIGFQLQSDSAADIAAGLVYDFDCEGDGNFEVTGALTPQLDCVYTAAGDYQPVGIIYDKDGDDQYFETTITAVLADPPSNTNNLSLTISSDAYVSESQALLIFYEVSNIGTERALNIQVETSLSEDTVCTIGTLDPGVKTTCTGFYQTTLQDAATGEIRLTALIGDLVETAIISYEGVDGTDGSYPRILTTPDRAAAGEYGWVLYDDNTKHWVDGLCRAQLESAGLTLDLLPWAKIDTYRYRAPSTCDAIGGGRPKILVTPNHVGVGDYGWVLYPDDTKHWVDSTCRAQLESEGLIMDVKPWSEIALYNDAAYRECGDILN